MFCYKDRTFCVSPSCVNACGCKLTPEIESAAQTWWVSRGGNGVAPISVAYLCGHPKTGT